jgi:PadR family transcriptional regulator PadR
MGIDKSLLAGSTTMLVLKLLDGQDMYGYQMIEELARRSDRTFELKAGTLYPLLHSLEEKALIRSYDKDEKTQRPRRYYQISPKGKRLLADKQAEWTAYTGAVNRVLRGGDLLANA